MNAYESLTEEACKDGIDILERNFNSQRIHGLYCDGTVAVNKSIPTTAKTCVLAEELGHYHTTVGDITDMSDPKNRKQERQARLWGYNKLIGLTGIINAYKRGCQNIHEMAEFLDVTEEYLKEAIDCYRDKYGVCTTIDNYTVFFIPYLTVMEKV